MRKLSRSIFTIGLTTSILFEGALISHSPRVSAATSSSFRQLTANKKTQLKLFKSSEVVDQEVQLATGASQNNQDFAGSLQDTINQMEA